MKQNSKKKKFPKDPNIKYVESLWEDPEFLRLYKKSHFRLGVAIEIARLRHDKKMSQKKLAQLLDTSQAVISRIERGHENFSLDRLMKIAEALDAEAKVTLVKKLTSPRKR